MDNMQKVAENACECWNFKGGVSFNFLGEFLVHYFRSSI